MFLTRSEYGAPLPFTRLMNPASYTDDSTDRGVNTFSPEGRLFQGTSYTGLVDASAEPWRLDSRVRNRSHQGAPRLEPALLVIRG